MKWRPWPPLPSKKFDARITLNHLRGLDLSPELRDSCSRFTVEIRWKGPKGIALRRSVRRNFTKEGFLGSDGVVRWDEEFRCLCNFSSCKDGALFHPWEVSFTLLNVSSISFIYLFFYYFFNFLFPVIFSNLYLPSLFSVSMFE